MTYPSNSTNELHHQRYNVFIRLNNIINTHLPYILVYITKLFKFNTIIKRNVFGKLLTLFHTGGRVDSGGFGNHDYCYYKAVFKYLQYNHLAFASCLFNIFTRLNEVQILLFYY